MADNTIENMLRINTMLEEKSSQHNNGIVDSGVFNGNELDALINGYDDKTNLEYAKPIIKEEKRQPYNAKQEMERLKEIEENGGLSSINMDGRKIPRDIVESIISHPLSMKPFMDSTMDKFEEKLANSGIKAAVDVMNKVDKRDKEQKNRLNEQIITEKKNNGNIDYSIIRTIIESVIDEKIDDIRNSLNESAGNVQHIPSIKFLSFKDNFYFVDNDDNIYECVMQYKGKRKKKR